VPGVGVVAVKRETQMNCPECGGDMQSFSRGRRGTVMHRCVRKCSQCGYDTDDFEALNRRIFPIAPEPRDRERENFTAMFIPADPPPIREEKPVVKGGDSDPGNEDYWVE